MTLAAACGWSLARSLAVALVAWPVCQREARWLGAMDERLCRFVWCALAVTFLCPEMWTGYAWSGFAVRAAGAGLWDVFPTWLAKSSPAAIIARDAAVDEFLLDVLLFFRAVPVGTLALYFAPPPPLSDEALYCRKLAVANGPGLRIVPAARLGFALDGPLRKGLPAFVLMFLVSFQEFELASLLGRPAWTVWLFDAQVGGLPLDESLRLALGPVCCQAVALGPLAWVLATARRAAGRRASRFRSVSRSSQAALYCLVVAGITATCAVPAVLVGRGTFSGLARIVQNTAQLGRLLKEIMIGTGYALAAALASACLAAWLLPASRRSRFARAGLLVVSLPGLFGPLVLGLAAIKLLNQPYLHVLYKTPAALAAGMALFLLPRAIALRSLLWSHRPHTAAHLAALLDDSPSAAIRDAAHELRWQMRWRGEYWSVALLSYWGFLDLTIAYLLAPVTIVSVPVMLYNQMHFGKNPVLSALAFLTVLVPALSFVLASAARRFLFRWFWR